MNKKRRQQRREMEELQPLQPDYNHQFSQGELKDYDFRGWDIRRLPYNVNRAARCGSDSSHTVTGQLDCVGCNRPTWAVNMQLENVCETCDFYLRNQLWDMRAERAKARNMVPVNPFAESENREILFNPFKDEE